MNDSDLTQRKLGWLWWGASIAAALGAAWLLLQILAVIFAGNAPQAAILLGASVVVVGVPTLLIAIGALVYAVRHKSTIKVRQWQAGVTLSTVNAAVPLIAAGMLLAIKFGLA